MRFLICLVYFILFSIGALGQTTFVTIEGNVKDRDDRTNLQDIWVDLRLNDSTIVRTSTDSFGDFRLIVSKKAITLKCSIECHQNLNAYRARNSKDSECKGFYFGKQYLYGDLVPLKELLGDSNVIKVTQIYLVPVAYELKFPVLCFAKNSTQLTVNVGAQKIGDLLAEPSEALNYMRCFLKSSSARLRISGHSSNDEQQKSDLSIKRAQVVIDTLVKMGVDAKRLTGVGYGDQKPKVSPAQIKKAKTQEEKEGCNAINRRVTFMIVAWE